MQYELVIEEMYIPRKLIILHGRFDHPSRRN